MDSNPVAPFNMYSDEYVIWMENNKQTHSKDHIVRFIKPLVITSIITAIMIILAVFFGDEYLILNTVSAIGVLGVFTLLLLVGSLLLRQRIFPVITYYITNYRLIALYEKKTKLVKYGFITKLKSIDIITNSDKTVSIEFEWDDTANENLRVYGFQDVSNPQEIYELIKNQQSELKDRAYDFDVFEQ